MTETDVLSPSDGAAPPTVSVLMSTYAGDQPEWLATALESIFAQSRPPEQLVLTVDGPISAAQERVIAHYEADHRIANRRIVRLTTNGGLANALNAGARYCTGTWVMRMDSDDISRTDRTERQLAVVDEQPEIDLIGGWAEEFFEDDPETRIKSSEITHEALNEELKWRNVLCHPSVMLRATRFRSCDGYRTKYPYLEDWDLFARMMLDGARFTVVPQPLVRFRVSRQQARRRGGWQYVRTEIRFRTFLWRSGFINFGQYVVSTAAYTGFRLLTPSLRSWMYRLVRTRGASARA